MADNIRSLFDYREPPTLDSDGEGSKPPPPRGRGCGRKRKGTPVKVCDRVFVTEDEEESLSEHSYCAGDGQYQEGEDDQLPPAGSPYYLTDPTQLCVSELGEEGASGARAAMLYAPPANCRIREVHCGSQVRLVVIAIRDIAKGEEITVDYSLTEWGDNAMGFHSAVSPGGLECSSDPENNIKKEDDSGPVPLSLSVSDYLTPSWSLSPSSSPASHSEPSDSDHEEEDEEEELEELRGRLLRRRKKRKVAYGSPAKRKGPPRTPGRPLAFSSRSPHTSPPPPACRTPFATTPSSLPPTTNINNNININIGRGPTSGGKRQQCLYCGRHFRSLTRHLEKHHAQQPEVRKGPATTAATAPPKRGRRMKKEEEEKTEADKEEEEVAPPPSLPVGGKDDEPQPSGDRDEESGGEEKKGEMLSSRRPHMLPLLSSLSSLVAHLRQLQHSSFVSLYRTPQAAEAWRQLCHSTLALLILYNRRRECEVSKLTIREYQSRVTPPPVPPGSTPVLTPLEASLSPFERQVLSHLPRAGVLGKRGRVQPLILPPHSEPCLELLLQTRPGVGVDPQNPYLFARPYHSPATPLRGADLLRSLARASGTKNPQALTQARVRRQVAILTQLLLLGEGEGQGTAAGGSAAQRLEDFLQKEYHVTQSCARIGQDPGLMGRVGRVVLCGERDGVLFRGMSLHHICLELDVMSGNSADSFSDDSDREQRKAPVKGESVKKKRRSQPAQRRRASAPPTSTPSVNPSPSSSSGHKRSAQPKPAGKRGVLKRPWSEAERTAVEIHLSRNISELRVPAKADCERCLQLCPLLVTNRRDWRAIKFYCHNRIQLLKKRERREGAAQGLDSSTC
ncbi:hypothetical protein GJAV_G00165140 [Gymnothorax javanicus]|nr:hypothetical protein GJAV_G00165140 [Gymnothorax javanicus]